MSEGTGLLAVWMDVAAENEGDLNRWYETEHLSERMAVPGFLTARRYVSQEGEPKFVALYDLEAPAVLQSDAYMQIRRNATPLTREVGRMLKANVRNEYELLKSIGAWDAAPYTLLVRLETEPAHDAELNRWYDEEHLAALAGVPGVSGARRYRALVGTPKYLAVYQLAAPDVAQSDAWRKAADTPWTLKMRPLFKNQGRNVARLITALP